jgi:chaperonin GroEL
LFVTRDGVAVAREITLPNPLENLGCRILREASIAVNDQVGDGTTGTILIGAEILRRAHKLVVAGYDPVQLAREIESSMRFVEGVLSDLATMRTDEEALIGVGLLASGGDPEIAQAVVEASLSVGIGGTIRVEEGTSVGVEILFKQGLEVDQGWATEWMSHGNKERLLEAPLVALFARGISKFEDIRPCMEEATGFPFPLLVIAPYVEGEALGALIRNEKENILQSCAVRAPGKRWDMRSLLDDLAAVCQGEVLDPLAGFDPRNFSSEWFGKLRSAVVRQGTTTLVAYPEADERIDTRIATLESMNLTSESEFDRDRLNERIAALSEGLCVLRVGGVTASEIRDRCARVEDTLHAVQCAIREGVLPGGGIGYLIGSEAVKGNSMGDRIVAESLLEPIRALARNAKHDPSVVLDRIRKARESDPYGSKGWDPIRDEICDLANGPKILDPAGVVISVCRASTSVASNLLKTECSLIRA